MNVINFVQTGFSARLFAGITIVSLLLSALPVAFFVALAAPANVELLVINEVDVEGSSDWVEIYNPGPSAVGAGEANRLSIHDGTGHVIDLPNTSIAADSYVVLEVGKRLNNGGDTVVLIYDNPGNGGGEEVIDDLAYGSEGSVSLPNSGETISRIPNGTGDFASATPTKGENNDPNDGVDETSEFCDPTQKPGGVSIAQWHDDNQFDGSSCFDYEVDVQCGSLDAEFTENQTPFNYTFFYVIGSETPNIANYGGDGQLPANFTEDQNGGSVDVTYYLVGAEKDYFVGSDVPNIWDENGVTVTVDTDCENDVPPLEIPERCSVEVDEFSVLAKSSAGSDTSVILENGREYFAVVEGTYNFGAPKNGSDRLADAEYSLDAGTTDWVKEIDNTRPEILDLFIDGSNPDFGAFRSDHTYGTFFTGTGAASNFAIQDNPHSDNSGELDVAIYECESEPEPEPKATLRVCKMIVDENGDIADGAGTAGEFSVDMTGPGGYDETFTFTTPLTANTDLVNDNGTELDAYCEVVELDKTGQYTYTEEMVVPGNAVWATPLYHDFFTETPDELADFAEFTIDGSENDNDDTDGVINVQKGKTRTLAIVNTIDSIPSVPVTATKIVCDYEEELPNWAKGNNNPPAEITATTASDWLVANPDTLCREVEWDFQWSGSSVSSPSGYNTYLGEAPGWNTFSGSIDVPFAALDGGNIEFREVLTEEYIPFSGGNDTKPSAELYCGTDVLNYDNLERVNKPKVGEPIYCVAWNVPKEPPMAECTLFSDTDTVVKETNQEASETYVHPSWTNDIDGDAEWIWVTEFVESPTTTEIYTFVETFEVSNLISAEMDIAADNKLLVKVNGVTVFDRTNQNNYVMPHTDVDISGPMVDGENIIEFVITNDAGSDRPKRNPAGVLYRIDIKSDGRNSCEVTTEPEPEPEPLPPVTTCSYVSDFAINSEPSQGNVDSNLTTYSLNDLVYGSGDEFDLFVLGDTSADGAYQDEVVVERTADGLEVFFYGNGSSQPVKEFSGTFTLQGVDLTNAVITAGSEPLETTGTWPDAISLDQSTGVVTFTMYTNTANDSFVISGLTADCGGNEPDTYTISGVKYEVDGETQTLASGWTIYASNGVDTPLSTTTDQNGYYYFDVPAGEWEVYEENRADWDLVDIEQSPMLFFIPLLDEVFDVQSSELETMASCNFGVGFDQALSLYDETNYEGDDFDGYTCDFYNEYTASEEDEDDGEETVDPAPQRTSSRSSGTRTNRSLPQAAPAPLVAGVSTDQCPFLVDSMQMGWDNDPMEVMKLQLFLNIFKDMYGGTANPVTGTFGIITDTNVKAFQTHFRSEVLEPWFSQGIVGHTKPTGFVYKTTLWKINDIVCGAEFPSLEGENLETNVDINARAIED